MRHVPRTSLLYRVQLRSLVSYSVRTVVLKKFVKEKVLSCVKP